MICTYLSIIDHSRLSVTFEVERKEGTMICISQFIQSKRKFPKSIDFSPTSIQERWAGFHDHPKTYDYVSGKKTIDDRSVYLGNIENYIGNAQVPMGLMGPVHIKGVHAQGHFHVPLATTEGTLVASYQRGSKIINKSGGATVMVSRDCMTRVPGFVFDNMTDAQSFLQWAQSEKECFDWFVAETSNYAELLDVQFELMGNYVFMRLSFETGDAAGQNMVTIAAEAICHYLVKFSPMRMRHWFVESNLSGDKKATFASQNYGRGKRVTAEVTVPKKIIERYLHTSVEQLFAYAQMFSVAGQASGSFGSHGHFANGLTALFMATGQDVACVAESATGITKAHMTDVGDLTVSVTLPNLIVGTVGGGTHLPTQKECLELMGCLGKGCAKKLAEIAAVTVLAGELSIGGAIAAGEFTKAHRNYGRILKANKTC